MPSTDTQFKSGAAWRGNAKGRPRREHEARYQRIVYSALTEEAVFKAASKLVELAEQGDVTAIREILRLVLPRVPDPFELIESDNSAPDAQA